MCASVVSIFSPIPQQPSLRCPTDEDALLESLEEETESDPRLAYLREARIQQLSSDIARAKSLRSEGYGTYIDVKDEKNLLEITTSHEKCIVHFHKTDFNRCRIMDDHLRSIAEEHLEARVVKINVENAPFLVTKLGVKVLPCVIAFIDGVSVDRVIGFEGLGYSEDTFQTRDLEGRLVVAGVLNQVGGGIGALGAGQKVGDGRVQGSHAGEKEEGEEDDWD